MNHEDVPAELVEKARKAAYAASPYQYSPDSNPMGDSGMAAALAAVLPEYGARLLDQVKRGIRHEASKAELDGDWLRAWNLSTGHAASVVSEHAARLTEGNES